MVDELNLKKPIFRVRESCVCKLNSTKADIGPIMFYN